MAKTLITGGTGFVGGYVIDALIERGHNVRATLRPGEKPPAKLEGKGIEFVTGDVASGEGLDAAAEGAGAMIHLVGIIRERPGADFEKMHVDGTLNALKAAASAGVKRYIHMSALGSRPDGVSRYHKTKWRAEEAVRASGLPYVIFRPSVIFGPGDEFMNKLKSFYDNPLFIPVIGDGRPLMQPVFAGDVGKCFASAVDNPIAENMVFELSGPTKYTVPGLLDVIGRQTGKKRIKIKIPIAIMKPAAAIMQRLSSNPPLTTDQLIMLQEDNIADNSEARRVFGLDFTPIEDIIPVYL